MSAAYNSAFVNMTLLTGVGHDPAATPENGADHNPKLMIDPELYNETTKNNKFNSFPMRQKKPPLAEEVAKGAPASASKLKPAPRSASSIQQPNTVNPGDTCISLSQDELSLTVKLARTRRQEAERLKHLIRNNCWPAAHPIRKYLWKCLLDLSSSSSSTSNSPVGNGNKENQDNSLGGSEAEYNKHLNQIFGKSKFYIS
jgi:hypothetical protein